MSPSKTTSSSDRRLERAIQHVGSLWFPINPAVLQSIRAGLEKGRYESDVTPLIKELKKDFALFTYVIKELITISEAESVPLGIRCNPIKLIEWAGVLKLTPILGKENELPSNHQLITSESFQSNRLKETAIIASTAEVLSESQNLDPEMGFSQGVLQEVGLNLIAWNYPSLFSRIINSLTTRATLEEELARELGFNPSALAAHILRPDLTHLRSPEEEQHLHELETYEHLCHIGQALNRANNPDTYPSAESDWRRANDYISKHVGSDGINRIRARTMEHTDEYKFTLPCTFSSVASFDPEKVIQRRKMGARVSENQYLKHCPLRVQTALRSVYSKMSGQGVDKDIIEQIVKKVIPEAGFTGGCVFLMDPSQMSLLPLSVIGRVKRRRLGTINLKNAPGSAMVSLVADTITTISHTQGDPALVAFNCSQPLIEREGTDSFESTAGIYSSLGTRRRIGVLYLELPDDQLSVMNSSAVKTFKALRQALCDALMID